MLSGKRHERTRTGHKGLGAGEEIAPIDLLGPGLWLEKVSAGPWFSERNRPQRSVGEDSTGKALLLVRTGVVDKRQTRIWPAWSYATARWAKAAARCAHC